jgi:hypothetical protein
VSLPEAGGKLRQDIRTINGEALRTPFLADLCGTQLEPDKIPRTSRLAAVPMQDRGPVEDVDPITACIAVSASPLRSWTEEVPDPSGHTRYPSTPQELPVAERQKIQADYNKKKQSKPDSADDEYTVASAVRQPDGRVIATIRERPRDARLRWQQEYGEKSFHSAIFDSAENHCHVTAFDLSIGSGRATSDRMFHAYLCAVADWRIKLQELNKDHERPGIPTWNQFANKFGCYYECEPAWRKELILANAKYYGGEGLPAALPILKGSLSRIVIAETTSGNVVTSTG